MRHLIGLKTRNLEKIVARGNLTAWPGMGPLVIVDCTPWKVGDRVKITVERLMAKPKRRKG